MAQNLRVSVPAGAAWTQLTDADAAGDVSIMLVGNYPVTLQATADATPPTDGTNGPLELLRYGDGWSEATIEEKFPGVVGADRLWARRNDALGVGSPGSQDAIVGISHA